MSVIPDLERQLVRAAARASAKAGRSRRRWRLTVASATAVGLAVFVVAAIDFGGGSGNASAAAKVLERAARSAAGGLTAARMHPGEAWFASELAMNASPWPVPTSGDTSVLPTSRAVTESRSRSQDWLLYDGSFRSRSWPVDYDGYFHYPNGQFPRPRLFGSAADRARWIAAKGAGGVEVATGGAVGSSNGFTVGHANLSYQQVLHFPTDPTAVLQFLYAAELGSPTRVDLDPSLSPTARAAMLGALAKLPIVARLSPDAFVEDAAALLTQVPLLPAARAAVFRALERIPGIRYLGAARDPLGRPGVAVAIDTAEPAGVPLLGRPTPGPVSRVRSELIFNPQTAGLLAQETLLLNPPHIPGVSAPFPTSWTAYLSSRVVPQSNAPTLKQLGYRPPPRQPLPPPTVSSPPVGFPRATTTTSTSPATTTTTAAPQTP